MTVVNQDELLPDFLEYLHKSGVGEDETKRYKRSLAVLFEILDTFKLKLAQIESQQFKNEYFKQNRQRRKNHLNTLKRFFFYKGLLGNVQTNNAGQSIPLTRLQDDFIDELKRKNYRPGTIKNYRDTMHIFANFCRFNNAETIDRLSKKTVYDYQNYLFVREKAHYCLNRKIHILYELKNFFRFLFEKGHTLIDMGTFIDIPKQEKKITDNIFKKEEMHLFFNAIDTNDLWGFMDRTMFEILYATGMRINELCGLTVKDINLSSETVMIRQGKGAKDRVVPITRMAARYLEVYLDNVRPRIAAMLKSRRNISLSEALFPGQNGSHIPARRVQGILTLYLKKAGIKKGRSPHALRYSCATHMSDNGAGIRLIGELLGHRQIDTTGRYTKVSAKNMLLAIGFHPREQGEAKAELNVKFKGHHKTRH